MSTDYAFTNHEDAKKQTNCGKCGKDVIQEDGARLIGNERGPGFVRVCEGCF